MPISQGIKLIISLVRELDPNYQYSLITNMDRAVQALQTLESQQSKKILKSMDRLINIFDTCLAEHPNTELIACSNLLYFIVSSLSEYPKTVVKDKVLIKKIFQRFCKTIVKISFEIPQSWMNPPQGFDQNKFQTSNKQANAQARILDSISQFSNLLKSKTIIQIFYPYFIQLINTPDDWRYQYSAFMLASQISNNNAKIQDYNHFIDFALHYLTNPHPKIRYACFHLLAQYSNEMKPDLQDMYYDAIVPEIIKAFDDPVLRVVTHAFNCLTNFMEKMEDVQRIELLLGQTLGIFSKYLKNANSYLKQSVITALTAIATVPNSFGPFLIQALELINEVALKSVGSTKRKHVLQLSYQCISFMLTQQPQQYVKQYVNNFITMLFANVFKINHAFFYDAWKRICVKYKSFTDFNTIFEQLFNLVQSDVAYGQDQLKILAIQSMVSTCQSFATDIIPFAHKLIDFSRKNYYEYYLNIDAKAQSLQLIYKIVQCTKSQEMTASPTWKTQIYDQLLNFFPGAIYVQEFHHLYQSLFRGQAKFIKLGAAYLTLDEAQFQLYKLNEQIKQLEGLFTDLIKQLKKINVDGIDNQEKQIGEIEVQLENLLDASNNLSQCFEAILLVQYGEVRQKAKQMMISESKRLIGKNDQNFIYLGINVSLALIKFSYEQLPNTWWEILNLYLSLCKHSHPQLRNLIVFALGEMFLNTPLEQISQQSLVNWLQTLWQAHSAPYRDKDEEKLRIHSKENVVSAIGKLIFKCAPKFPQIINRHIYSCWFGSLPLNQDLVEGDVQQRYLIGLLLSNPSMVVENCEDLKQLCIIYSNFLNARDNHENTTIIEATKESLKAIIQWPIFKQSQNFLWNNLSNLQKVRLMKLL